MATTSIHQESGSSSGQPAMEPQRKCWAILENNPDVMDQLAARLGLSSGLGFHDVYSLDDPSLLAHIPRPSLALLAIIPLTPAWDRDRRAEDARLFPSTFTSTSTSTSATSAISSTSATSVTPDHRHPVIWFPQTIGNACGSIGLLHCAINGPAREFITPGSGLARLREQALPLGPAARADLLYHSAVFEAAHRSVEQLGDSDAAREGHAGQHFVAFVKAEDGHLWELEGSRAGPIDRGALAEDEDVLSPRALELGLKRVIRLGQREGGDGNLRFSCTALARRG